MAECLEVWESDSEDESEVTHLHIQNVLTLFVCFTWHGTQYLESQMLQLEFYFGSSASYC